MKKIIRIIFLVVFGGFPLSACHNLAPNNEQTLEPMSQSYRGILPCADCSGLDTSLFLQQDGTYILSETYQGTKDHDQTFGSYGIWARTADKLVLTDVKGIKRYFHPKGEDLEVLDIDGSRIQSTLNYQLKATQQDLPKTPMSLSGMYQYQADAATFTDCATGKIFPVSNSFILESAYLKVRNTPNQLVFVSMYGYFTIEPSMEEGRMQKSLVADGSVTFNSMKRCP